MTILYIVYSSHYKLNGLYNIVRQCLIIMISTIILTSTCTVLN